MQMRAIKVFCTIFHQQKRLPMKLYRSGYSEVGSNLFACYRLKIMNTSGDWLELLGNFAK